MIQHFFPLTPPSPRLGRCEGEKMLHPHATDGILSKSPLSNAIPGGFTRRRDYPRRPSIRAGPTTGQSLFTVFARRQICGSLGGSPPISRSVPFRVTRWRYGGPHQVDTLVNTHPTSGYFIPPLPLLNSHHAARLIHTGTTSCFLAFFFIFQAIVSAPAGTSPVSK
jgi:hypothetical protein